MAAAFQVGDRVQVAVASVTRCKPGDTGTVVAVSLISSGDAYYHIKMDPPSAVGTVICYGNEIEPASPK